MNLKNRRIISKLMSFTNESNLGVFTHGTLKITDKEVVLISNGSFRRLSIYFTGNMYIYNNLPDGYSIKMTDSLISISNLLLKNLKNNNILFSYDGNFEISKAHIMTLSGKKVQLNVEDIDRLELISNSKTNLEDNSLLLLEEGFARENPVTANGIDDDSIKGLFADKPLIDGYTGYYNYHPKEKIYMSGKILTSKSNPIGKTAVLLNKDKPNISKVLNKIVKNAQVKMFKNTVTKEKPITTKKRKVKKTTKGGKY